MHLVQKNLKRLKPKRWAQFGKKRKSICICGKCLNNSLNEVFFKKEDKIPNLYFFLEIIFVN